VTEMPWCILLCDNEDGSPMFIRKISGSWRSEGSTTFMNI
jgi:hypothetical protein